MAFRQFLSLSALFLAMAQTVPAQDGGQLYEMVCGACHGADGNGAGEGTFPPMQGSEWIKGDPERLIQIILHGVEGPIEVAGSNYNLAMPPQGSALVDEQIVAIVNYVRSAWGASPLSNEGPAEVALADVEKARKNSGDRKTMWTAEELLEKWPFPVREGPLRNLVVTTYQGNFRTMPNFSTLEAHAVIQDADGYVDLESLELKDNFAAVWEGEFLVANDADHIFDIDSDDGSRLIINGQVVAEVKGVGPVGRPRRGRVLLEKGLAKFRLEYFEHRGKQGLAVSMRQGRSTLPFSRERPKPGPLYDEELIEVGETARIYRNFIKGTSARSIGVGYPGGINLSYNADSLGVSQAWLGNFIDAGLHWTGRGIGSQDPAGQRVLDLGNEPALAILDRGRKESWPKKWQRRLKPRFRGYRLDEKRRPEFCSTAAGLSIEDRPEVVGSRELVRTLRFQADSKLHNGLALRLSGPGAKQVDAHTFQLKGGVLLKFAKFGSAKPEVYDDRVIVRLASGPGEQRIGIRYLWK